MTVQIEYLGFEQDDFASPNNGPTGAEVTHTFTIASGDLLVAFVNRNNTTTSITPPTGWIELKTKAGAETSLYWIGYRIAGSSEPSSWTWDIGESTSWDISVRHYRTNGSNIQFSDILEDAGTAGQTATINTQAVPVNSLSLIHIQTDTSGAYCQSVTGFDFVLPASTTSRTQQTGHFINTDYEKSPATPTVTFNTGSTAFVSNHFYITWAFQKSVLGPAYIRRPWTKQPPTGTPIDWSNPLTQGLLFFAPVDQFGRDAVSGEAPTSLGVGGQIRLEHNAGNLGSGWCFDTRGGVESGDGEGFYWGTGLKNGTFPKDFYNRGQGSLGWTTMTWARRESDTVAWQMYFGVARDGNNYYQGCLVRDGTNNEVVLRMQDATGSDSALLGGTDFAIRASGVDHWVGTMQNTGSASRMTLYKNGVVSETITIGSGRSVELDAISTNECGIVANAYAFNADPLDGITMANAIWNRELSAAEVASLYENPWQIFKPRNIYIGTPPKRKVVVY